MVTEPQYQLTTRDHAILQAMFDQHRGPHDPFMQLLDRKLRSSASSFSDDMPPDVVTLGSRVAYRIDGAPAGPHVLAEEDKGENAADALSIRTVHGLALLGLAEGAAVSIDLGDGITQTLQVETVLSQPEAQARMRQNERGRVGEETGSVVHFRPRMTASRHPGHDDDDPGPRAA